MFDSAPLDTLALDVAPTRLVTGTANLTLPLTLTATGSPRVTGTASIRLTATARPRITGATTLRIAVTTPSTGTPRLTGTALLPLPLRLIGAGGPRITLRRVTVSGDRSGPRVSLTFRAAL